jgi:DNA-directed RNA polymerase specialized sigma24 family protein
MQPAKSRTYWSSSDIRFLEENYDLYTTQELADILGRSYSAVASKAKELGIRLLPKVKNWDDEQVDYVLQHCSRYCLHQLSRGTGKTIEQIRAFLKYRGYEPVKCSCPRPGKFNSNIEKIRKLAEFHTLKEMADILGTSPAALHKFLKKERIAPVRKIRNFTKDEDEFLRRHVYDMSIVQLAKYLKRSTGSISSRIYALRIRRKDIDPNPRCVKRLIAETGASKVTIHKAAKALGIDYQSRKVLPGWSYFTEEEFEAMLNEIRRRQKAAAYTPWTEEEVETLITLYKEGVTYNGISEQMNISKRRVEVKLKNLFREGRLKQRQPKKK